jgi:hypothetical protein
MEIQRDVCGTLLVLFYIASSLLMALIYCKIRWDYYKRNKIDFLSKVLFPYPYILIYDFNFTKKEKRLYDSTIVRCITFWDYYKYVLLKGHNLYFIFFWPLYLLFHWLMATIQWIIFFFSWLWILARACPKLSILIISILLLLLCCY